MSRLEVSDINVFVKENSAELKPYGNFSTKIIKGISKQVWSFPVRLKTTDTELISIGVY